MLLLAEQIKIANFLTAIDDKINGVTQSNKQEQLIKKVYCSKCLYKMTGFSKRIAIKSFMLSIMYIHLVQQYTPRYPLRSASQGVSFVFYHINNYFASNAFIKYLGFLFL